MEKNGFRKSGFASKEGDLKTISAREKDYRVSCRTRPLRTSERRLLMFTQCADGKKAENSSGKSNNIRQTTPDIISKASTPNYKTQQKAQRMKQRRREREREKMGDVVLHVQGSCLCPEKIDI